MMPSSTTFREPILVCLTLVLRSISRRFDFNCYTEQYSNTFWQGGFTGYVSMRPIEPAVCYCDKGSSDHKESAKKVTFQDY